MQTNRVHLRSKCTFYFQVDRVYIIVLEREGGSAGESHMDPVVGNNLAFSLAADGDGGGSQQVYFNLIKNNISVLYYIDSPKLQIH